MVLRGHTTTLVFPTIILLLNSPPYPSVSSAPIPSVSKWRPFVDFHIETVCLKGVPSGAVWPVRVDTGVEGMNMILRSSKSFACDGRFFRSCGFTGVVLDTWTSGTVGTLPECAPIGDTDNSEDECSWRVLWVGNWSECFRLWGTES